MAITSRYSNRVGVLKWSRKRSSRNDVDISRKNSAKSYRSKKLNKWHHLAKLSHYTGAVSSAILLGTEGRGIQPTGALYLKTFGSHMYTYEESPPLKRKSATVMLYWVRGREFAGVEELVKGHKGTQATYRGHERKSNHNFAAQSRFQQEFLWGRNWPHRWTQQYQSSWFGVLRSHWNKMVRDNGTL